MNKKIWVHKASSFDEAHAFETNYYLSMTPEERLETIQYLREMNLKLKWGKERGQSGKGLRRVIKILQ